jgi:hypothetical protein
MQDTYPDVPRSVRYPLGDIAEMLGTTADKLTEFDHFLSSSVPQAVALAVLHGYPRIEVYGVAMETNTEYQFQREGVAFWIGFARGRGIDLYFADPTFRAPLYGYEGKVSIEYAQLDERIEELKTYLPELAAQHQAVIMEAKEAVRQFTETGSKDRENTLHTIAERAVHITSQVGALRGAIQENERYKKKADAMRDAAEGEFVFSRQEFEGAASSFMQQAKKEESSYIGYGTLLGRIQDEIQKAPKGSKKRTGKAEEFWATFRTYLQTVEKMNALRGAANEDNQYMQYLDKYVRAAGGSKSEEVLLDAMQKGELVNA